MHVLSNSLILCCLLTLWLTSVGGSSHDGSDDSSLDQFSSVGSSHQMLYIEKPWLPKMQRRAPSGGVSKKCMHLLEEFTNATGVYLECILTNARPLHYCENCVAEYSSAVNAYKVICHDDENGTTCRDQLFRADNVQVVLLTYHFVEDIWDKSDCHNCYNRTVDNGTEIYKPTNDTLEMLDRIQKVQDCFHSKSINVNMSVCDRCARPYTEANIYYSKLDKDNKLCSDLQDSMNYTRIMWSKVFKCDIGIRTDLMIYGIAVAIGFLPLTFYLGVFVGTTRQKRRLRLRRREQGSPDHVEPINLIDPAEET